MARDIRISLVENEQRIRQAARNIKYVLAKELVKGKQQRSGEFNRVIKKFKVGVAGLGSVGAATVKLLQEESDLISLRTGCRLMLAW